MVIAVPLGVVLYNHFKLDQDTVSSGVASRANLEVQVKLNNTDVQSLVDFLELSVIPTRAWWSERKLGNPDNTLPGPTDHELVAILELKPESMQSLIGELADHSPSKWHRTPAQWMPDEIADLGESYQSLRYDAINIVKAPFSYGTLERILDSPYAIVVMGTM